jgi:putative ABC transport system permease protein
MARRTPAEPDLTARWRSEVRRTLPGADHDLVEEVTQHLIDSWQRVREEGSSPAQADERVYRELAVWRRNDSRRSFFSRPAWRNGWLTDVKYAWRALRVKPLVTVAATLLTAIAATGSITAFAIAYGVLGRPLSYPGGERLVVLWQFQRGETGQISYPDFVDLSALPVFESAAAIMGGRGSLRVGDRIERVNALAMDAPGFALLGAGPHLGRLLNASDAGQPMVMISHRLWTSQFGADPAIVGRQIWLSGRTHTIVGVLRPGFDFELPVASVFKLEQHDIWSVNDPAAQFVTRRNVSTYEAIARLTPGTSLAVAQAAVDAAAVRLEEAHAGTNRNRGFRVAPLKSEIVTEARAPLLLMCAAAAAALVIALANLSTLTLLRNSSRQTELAVREALGASAMRLRRQMLAEHLATAALGGAVGYVIARQITAVLAASEAADLPRGDAIQFDAPVTVFAIALTLLVAALMTMLPLRSAQVVTALRTGDRNPGRNRRSRRGLVAVELALALALSAGGVLLGLSLMRLFSVNPGFSPEHVSTARVSAYEPRYRTIDDVAGFVSAILEELERTPGVTRAGAGTSLPLSGHNTGTGVLVEDGPRQDADRQPAGWQTVTPGYFESLGMSIVRGRDFSASDRMVPGHVTVVSESLARILFGSEDPIGRRITSGDGNVTADWHQIIGVVADVRHHALDREAKPRLYDLFGEHWGRTVFVTSRTNGLDATTALPLIRRAVAKLDPEAPVFEAATLLSLVDRSVAPYRLSALLCGGIACGAVLLALIGVYAVSAASVAERSRELGVRAALGASRRDLLRLVFAESSWTMAAGGAAGVAGALLAVRVLTSRLFGVSSADIATVVPAIAALVLVTAALAVLPPARRASRVDPLIALRTE